MTFADFKTHIADNCGPAAVGSSGQQSDQAFYKPQKWAAPNPDLPTQSDAPATNPPPKENN